MHIYLIDKIFDIVMMRHEFYELYSVQALISFEFAKSWRALFDNVTTPNLLD